MSGKRTAGKSLPINRDKPKKKMCTVCLGKGVYVDENYDMIHCLSCSGTGEVVGLFETDYYDNKRY